MTDTNLYFAIILISLLSALVVSIGGLYLGKFSSKKRVYLSGISLCIYALLLIIQIPTLWLSNGAVLMAAVSGGILLGMFLKETGSLSAFLITASLVDIFSFSDGLTAKIIQSYQKGESILLQYLAISIKTDGRVLPLVGVGDLLIIAAVVAVLIKLKFPFLWACIGPICGLLFALIIGLISGGIFGIPFIAGSTLICLFIYKRKIARSN